MGKSHYGLDFETSKQSDEYINKNSPFKDYKITSKTGKRDTGNSSFSSMHAGLDRAMPQGTNIVLPIDVKVIGKGYDDKRGNWIEASDKNSNVLHYQHLKDLPGYNTGDVVKKGEVLARSGNSGVGTGPHLHEEYYSASGKNITESYWSNYAYGENMQNTVTSNKKNKTNTKNQELYIDAWEKTSPYETYLSLKSKSDKRYKKRQERKDKLYDTFSKITKTLYIDNFR